MRVRYVDSRKDMVERPKVVDRLSAMRHDDKSSLAAQVVYHKLEERIDGEGLSIVSIVL